MEAFKIIFMLLCCGYYGNGHYLLRKYNNQRSPSFPSLNFQTFPEYFKPLYRIKYLPPSTTTAHRTQPHTPKPVNITYNIKKNAPLKRQSHGMLSLIKNVMNPLMKKNEKPYDMANQRARGRDMVHEHQRNHAIHLKLLPKLVKKEVAEQLGNIFGKIPNDTVVNNTKQEINKAKESKADNTDLANKKEKTTNEHPNLNEINEDEIKKKTGYINKIEAKSIFGNTNFANIFIFYPNNDNSALVVGLKDNLTGVFTEKPTEIFTKSPMNQLVDKTTVGSKEETPGIENDDNNLEGTKDNESSNDKINNTAVPIEVSVTTGSTFSTSDATITTTANIVNQGKDNTDDDESDLPGIKYNMDEPFKDNDSKTTEDSLMNSMSPSTTTVSVTDELIESPFENITESLSNKKDNLSTEAASSVVNEPESSSEHINDVKDGSEDEQTVTDENNSELDDKIKESDTVSTMAPTTVLNEQTESTSENLTEKLNDIKEKEIENDEEMTVRSTVMLKESTVEPDGITEVSSTEDTGVSTTEVPTSTGPHLETTNTESDSNDPSGSTTESTTIELGETLSSNDGENSTQSNENAVEKDNYLEDSADGDYMEVEYTYF